MSLFVDKGRKTPEFRLAPDSANMCFAACLKPEFNGGIEMDGEAVATVF